MTQKQKKSFLVTFIIMLVVLSAYCVVELQSIAEEAGDKKATKKSIVVYEMEDSDSVDELSYTVEDEKIVLKKDDNGEWYGEEIEELDTKIIKQEFLTQLSYVVADEVIEDDSDVSQFGFDKPLHEIVIVLKNGEEHKFVIGSGNAFEKSVYYMRIDNDKTIYVIDSVLHETFNKKKSELEKTEDNTSEVVDN
ncbi:MAG: DUF4340 domain-containing protein [Lachnospiraceae bacterium]|nr:DUF4340 domain-containing protein [Lachnospiraceae bacterium]